MSKFISKQSVAIWYALSALLATFIVGQVKVYDKDQRSPSSHFAKESSQLDKPVG